MKPISVIILVLLFSPLITVQGQNSHFKKLVGEFDQKTQSRELLQQKGWKPYGRWIEFMRERTTLDGVPADPGLFLEEATKVATQKKQAANLKTGQAWSPIGPFEMPEAYTSTPMHGMGRVNCITFHPTDPNTYWIGVAQGGVWKTSDGGESYIPLTDDLPILRVSDIAVDPVNPDVIYVSVGDYGYIGFGLKTNNAVRHSHYGLGVYKTTDGGQSWFPTGLSFDQSDYDVSLIRRVFISTDNSSILLAAGVGGIFKSEDGGSSWTQQYDDLFWDIEQDFINPQTIYASTGYVASLDTGQASLLRSDDFGETWVTLYPGFPRDQSISRVEIGLTPESSDYIYLVASNPEGGFYGFYRSIDRGENWETRKHHTEGQNLLSWWETAEGTSGQGWYDLAILVDPHDRERVFVGGVNMWGSEDGGLTWTMCSHWIMSNGFTLHADHHQYKYNPLDNKYYACHDGGVARTDAIIPGKNNSGEWNTSWEEKSNGMAITSFYRLGLSQNDDHSVIAGSQDNCTFYHNSNGWVNISRGDGMEAIIHPDNPDIVIASFQYGYWNKSSDGGQTFKSIRPSAYESGAWVSPLIMHPNNPDVLYGGLGNVWKSEDLGESWTPISDFPKVDEYNTTPISAMAISPANSDCLYVAKQMHHTSETPSSLWRAFDGIHFENITAGLPDSLHFTYIGIDDDDPLNIWLTCSGFLDGQKVYHSTDGGISWENISYNLPNIPVNTIVHQHGSDNNLIYIGTDAGVFYTWDDHNQWELYSTDLPNVIISELEIHYGSEKLFAATFGRGIWMADLASATSSGRNTDIESKLHIYPNPSSGDMNIQYAGLPDGMLTIEVVDILGKSVYQKNLQENIGNGSIRVQADLKPGVYFVRLHSGNRLRTRRITIH